MGQLISRFGIISNYTHIPNFIQEASFSIFSGQFRSFQAKPEASQKTLTLNFTQILWEKIQRFYNLPEFLDRLHYNQYKILIYCPVQVEFL